MPRLLSAVREEHPDAGTQTSKIAISGTEDAFAEVIRFNYTKSTDLLVFTQMVFFLSYDEKSVRMVLRYEESTVF